MLNINKYYFYNEVQVHSFFFQAEDGIRDYKVTGVQTCALPILQVTRQTRAAARVRAGDDQDRAHSPIAISATFACPWLCSARAARQARTPVRQHSTMRRSAGKRIRACSSASTPMRIADGNGDTGASTRLRRSITRSATETSAGAMNAMAAPAGSRASAKEKPPRRRVRKSTEIRRPSRSEERRVGKECRS